MKSDAFPSLMEMENNHWLQMLQSYGPFYIPLNIDLLTSLLVVARSKVVSHWLPSGRWLWTFVPFELLNSEHSSLCASSQTRPCVCALGLECLDNSTRVFDTLGLCLSLTRCKGTNNIWHDQMFLQLFYNCKCFFYNIKGMNPYHSKN